MKEYLWLHIKKAGGQSMRKALGNAYKEMNRSNPKPFVSLSKKKWNDLLNNFRMPLGEYDYKRMLFAKKFLYSDSEFDKMFKFVIVRNPYDRAVSSWLYCTKNRWKWSLRDQISLKYVLKNIYYFIAQKIDGNREKIAFQKFLEKLPKIWKHKNSRHTATHTVPVMPDITDNSGNILVDYIGKLENIDNNFKYICKKIGIPQRKFPIVNSSGRKKNYRKFYTNKSRKLVEEYYGNDINNFDYNW